MRMNKKFGGCCMAVSLLFSVAVQAAEVDDCINNSNSSDEAYSRCWLDEAKRLNTEIKNKYEQLASNKLAAEWNKGNGMFKGNLKDMYDSWVAYRNRFCSLSGVAGHYETSESKAFHQSLCLVNLSKKHNQELDGLLSTFASQMIKD